MLMDHLVLEAFVPRLEGKTKDDIITELVDSLSKTDVVENAGKLVDDILKREKIASTEIDKGVAIPHAKSSAVKKMCVVVGLKPSGVSFNNGVSKLVNVVFLVVAPPEDHQKYLKAIAVAARMAGEPDFRDTMLTAPTRESIVETLAQFDAKVEMEKPRHANGRINNNNNNNNNHEK